jgi:hypothetical protein
VKVAGPFERPQGRCSVSLVGFLLGVATTVCHGGVPGVAGPEIEVAGDLYVALDPESIGASGQLDWPNEAPESVGDFIRVDATGAALAVDDGLPVREAVAGAPAVTFNTTAALDAYQSPTSPPLGLVDANSTRTIEAWVYNPSVPTEETILAWGRRGGPNGSNMSFNYGTHALFGAVGHWGPPDIGWDNAGGAPPAGTWQYLAYSFDGTTTRVYVNGCLAGVGACETNSEVVGAGVIDTHDAPRITLSAQVDNDAGALNVALRGTLSLGRVRIHDGVLSAEQIENNYLAELPIYHPPGLCSCTNCPAEDVTPAGQPYVRQLQFTASPLSPITALTLVSPAGGTLSSGGLLTYNVPAGTASFEVSIDCTTSEGTENFAWTVTVLQRPVLGEGIAVADELFVLLDAAHGSAGTATWLNGGSASDFVRLGEPVVEALGPAGAAGVSFNGGATNDAYLSLENAPAGLTGINPTRTIEAWVFNPVIDSEETILAWGRRGGPNGSNMSFNYGTHALFGAVGHWGGDGPDLGWNNAGGAPEPGLWHHLAYTYDGETTRVFADGVQANREILGAGAINTWPDHPIAIAVQIADAAGNLDFGPREGTLSIGRVRIHDGVLTPRQIYDNYLLECEEFQGACTTVVEVPSILNEPLEDTFCSSQDVYNFSLRVVGTPPPVLEVISPVGAAIDANGAFRYDLPEPPPASFEVEVRASNAAGEDTATWTVTRQEASTELEIAGDLFVHLDARDLAGAAGGPADDFWPNQGDLADFVRVGDPQIVEIAGATAVSFNEGGRSGDSYQSQDLTPDGLVGPDPTRTIEAWVFNPTIPAEETILSWGRRGGPNGTNMSFNYGAHALYGAIGHWGGDGPDIGWNNAGGAPAANEWHHLAYTYDGTTTRVYADGTLWNLEELGPGIINTYVEPLIALAQQYNADGTTFTTALQGSLSIARVRIHDGVLSPCQIASNYALELPDFTAAPQFLNAPAADTYCAAEATYRFRLRVSGTPSPALQVESPAGATITPAGLLEYAIPDPAPASFLVRVRATNSSGSQTAQWTVSRQELFGDLRVAGELFVDLDVRDMLDGGGGGADEFWPNNGSLADFIRRGNPRVELRGLANVPAVSFNEGGRTGDSYQSQDPTPIGLVDPDSTRSIEVWVFNPAIPAEETILSWGRRGGPNGTNMSFNYGTHGLFGAVGHWGGDGPDIGWNDAGGAPAANEWHHLAYTYDGTTTRVYADGTLWNSEELGPGAINTHDEPLIALAQQYEGDGMTFTTALQGQLAIARVRIHDGVLSPCEIASNHALERSDFEPPPCPMPGGPDYADTHCTGLEVTETGATFGPTHILRASAVDDSGDPVLYYTFTATPDVGAPVIVGPQTGGEARVRLAEANWTFTVLVDDRPDCDDQAADATCRFPPEAPEEICDNDTDDDGDGQTDCDDSDCAKAASCLGTRFVRGDPNASGSVDLTDGIVVLNYLFLGGVDPVCFDAADTDDNGALVISDAVIIFAWLFQGGMEPRPPSPDTGGYSRDRCDLDPSADGLDCAAFAPCQ